MIPILASFSILVLTLARWWPAGGPLVARWWPAGGPLVAL